MATSALTCRIAAATGIFFVMTNVLLAVPAQVADKEIKVRAAFLLNFVKFTNWPEEAFETKDAPLVLAVVGEDPFGSVLEQTFARQRIHGRAVHIQRIAFPQASDHETADEYRRALAKMRQRVQQAHVAYFSRCRPDELELVLGSIDTSFILTVGNRRECAETATSLALDRLGERIVFYANLHQIESSELRVSSRLLALARALQFSGPEESE